MRADRQDLIRRARFEQLTRPGEPFNAPARVQRLTDLMGELANAIEADAGDEQEDDEYRDDDPRRLPR